MARKNKYAQVGPKIHHYKHRRSPNRSVGGDIGIYIFLLICSAIMIFPLVFAISNSLKPLDELLKQPQTVFPRRITGANYSDLFVTLSQSYVPFTRYIFNTLFVTATATVCHVIVASMAAYVLAKYRFPGGDLFFRVAVVALMFSGYVTGIPIKFIGVSEKMDGLDEFYPDRMASRILGMGDLLSLVEKIQDATDLAKAMETQKKISKNEFTLEQFLDSMQMIKKVGSLETIMGMIPGMGNVSKMMSEANVGEKEMARIEAILRSMTPKERQNPSIINGSRRKRIALGSGMSVQDVNKLLKNFEDSKKVMKQFQSMAKFAPKGGFKLPFGR